ncbi:unnamed protein product [Schistosoma turkestanicum]|nr:unnamed protein product [Schistosoma turkestanicum]
MQVSFVFTILLLWLLNCTEQTTISRRQQSSLQQQIQFASLPEQSINKGNSEANNEQVDEEGEEKQGGAEEEGGTHRAKRLSDLSPPSTTYRNPFSAFLKRKRHSKSTDSRVSSVRKEFISSGDSKCGLMCHLLCRPGCSKICYSSCS